MGNRIDRTFVFLRKAKRKALIGYITAGFPTKGSLKTLVPLLEDSGLDILEIGVPFSDPIADGPTIQFSSQVALKKGVTLRWILQSIKSLRERKIRLPIVLMSYGNPIYSMGIDIFFKQAKAAGVDGVIVPDLIIEESGIFEIASRRSGVYLIHLVAPTTPKARARLIAGKTRGFLYAVSLTGVTGVQKAVPADVSRFLKSIRTASRMPVAVGFGLTTAHQVQSVSRDADGVIVGSELIRQIQKSKHASFRGAANFVKSLRRALDTRKGAAHAS